MNWQCPMQDDALQSENSRLPNAGMTIGSETGFLFPVVQKKQSKSNDFALKKWDDDGATNKKRRTTFPVI